MTPFVKSLLAVLAGIVVTFVLIATLEALGSWMYPPPKGMDISNPASIKALIDLLPTGALVMVLAAWLVGTFTGAFVAGRIAGRSPMWHGAIIAVFAMAAGLADMMMIPHPLWFWIAAVVVFISSGLCGGLLSAKRSA